MKLLDTLKDLLWYWGFLIFCEIRHPLHKPLKILRRVVQKAEKDKPVVLVGGLRPRVVPKKIWIFWAQGWDTAPHLVKVCRDSWATHNPDWDISLLTKDDIPKHTEFDYSLEDKHLSYTNYSNLLRLSLLSKYGGVWVDATTFCSEPLNNWLPSQMQSGFFVFSKPKTTVADWIVATEKDHPLIQEWAAYEYRYWKFAKTEGRYFWPHYLFEYLISNNKEMRRIWERTPRVNSDGPYAAQRCFKKGGTPDQFLDILLGKDAPIHKLDWRMEVPDRVLTELRSRLKKS